MPIEAVSVKKKWSISSGGDTGSWFCLLIIFHRNRYDYWWKLWREWWCWRTQILIVMGNPKSHVRASNSSSTAVDLSKTKLVRSISGPVESRICPWDWIRSVSGEGHLNGSFPPPKEASTRNRLLIYTNTPIQINSETLVTPVITEDILSYKVWLLCNL